jgi:hypothetical protein
MNSWSLVVLASVLQIVWSCVPVEATIPTRTSWDGLITYSIDTWSELTGLNSKPSTVPPSWARWEDPNGVKGTNQRFQKVPGTDHDDTPTPIPAPFSFKMPLFRSWPEKQTFIVTPNGLVAFTKTLPCVYFCNEFNNNFGISWPVVAVYATDLDASPSVLANSSEWNGIFAAVRTDPRDVKQLGDVTIQYDNVPLWGASNVAGLANLTAQMVLCSNGTVILRYKTVPQYPNGAGTPGVGLFLSPKISATIDPPQWTSASGSTTSGNDVLTYSALRFERSTDVCSRLFTCQACSSNSLCVWCSDLPLDLNTSAGCLRHIYADAFCLKQNQYEAQCSIPKQATDFYSIQLVETSNLTGSGYLPDLSALQPVSPQPFQTRSGMQRIALPFPFPMYYSPASGAFDVTHPRMYSTLMLNTSGFILTSDLTVGFSCLGYSALWSSLLWKVQSLETRLIDEPFCDKVTSQGAPYCPPAFLIAVYNLLTASPSLQCTILLEESGRMIFSFQTETNIQRSVSPVSPIGVIPQSQLNTLGGALLVPWPMLDGDSRLLWTQLPSCPRCQNRGVCDNLTRVCNCVNGFVGESCEACPPGYYVRADIYPPYTVRCVSCPGCFNGGNCSALTGICTCPPNFDGPRCEVQCSGSFDPWACRPGTCNLTYGSCVCGQCVCSGGASGPRCQYAPADDQWGGWNSTKMMAAVGIALLFLSVGLVLFTRRKPILARWREWRRKRRRSAADNSASPMQDLGRPMLKPRSRTVFNDSSPNALAASRGEEGQEPTLVSLRSNPLLLTAEGDGETGNPSPYPGLLHGNGDDSDSQSMGSLEEEDLL